MSRGNEPAFPVAEVVNSNGDTVQHAAPGLTIREEATLRLFAVAANMPNYSRATMLETLTGCAQLADVFVGWLDRGGK